MGRYGMKFRCGLCTYIYDEDVEPKKWDELTDDWVCPICGSPKSSFSPVIEKSSPNVTLPLDKESVFSYECSLCSHVYDENNEPTAWKDLPDDWRCPVCGSGRENFILKTKTVVIQAATEVPSVNGDYLSEWQKPFDDFETHMSDIHKMSITGETIIEPMRTRLPSFSWDEILFKGVQLTKLALNKSQPVSTQTVIGPQAAVPLILDTPLIVTHMSYGALSKEAKIALAKGSAELKTAMSSGEGGILPESLGASYKYIFEYVPNKYSVSEEFLRQVDAVEIKIGQSAKPGMGGHLPGHKVTKEIAKVRGFREGKDIISPSHFPDIRDREDLKKTVSYLRKETRGKPVGIKIAAGHIEEDIDIALYAVADFITIDGRAGGTGAAPKVVKNTASIPTIFALARARKHLDSKGSKVSLIITGGLRVSSDFAKALAMGADVVALGTAAMMALGCQQYRVCNTGKCPVGITTQDPALRARFNIDQSSARVANYFQAATKELKDFARLTGNHDVHDLGIGDLCTTNSEISKHTVINHV